MLFKFQEEEIRREDREKIKKRTTTATTLGSSSVPADMKCKRYRVKTTFSPRALASIPFGLPGPFPQLRLWVIWLLRIWVRGSREEVWRIASSMPGTGGHCWAGIQSQGGGWCGEQRIVLPGQDLTCPFPHTCL